MRTRSKFVLMALAAASLLAVLVSTASARRLEVSNQAFRVIWTLLTFTAEGAEPVTCPVTLEGSFHSRTLSKVSGQLVGYVTKAFVRGDSTSCLNSGTATVLSATLPWHIRYASFTGTLPNITGITIQLINASFRVHAANSLECLARTEAAHPGVGTVIREAGGLARQLRVDETAGIPLTGEFGFCSFAGESTFRGTAEVFLQGSTSTRIRVTLVQ